jgi:hypothetical protein
MAARRKKATKRKATKRKATRGASRKKAAVANLVVNSKVKEAVKAHGYRMAGDFGDALNAKVGELIQSAVARCEANGRGTVRPQDL